MQALDTRFAFEGGGNRFVEQLLRDRISVTPFRDRPVDMVIHRDDEMLEHDYLHEGGDWDAGLVSYFRNAFEIIEAQRQLADWRFGGFDRVDSLLDFGCGFGRAMRLLVRELDPNRIFVSDLYQEALDFQAERYGVTPLLSKVVPEELAFGREFDFIWVGSLFTHLPEGTFTRWLNRLCGFLSKRGLLAFTIHHERFVPPGHSCPESGMLFLSTSESHTHDKEQYGSTWVSSSFVERQIAIVAEKAGKSLASFQIPRAIHRYQDVVLVAEQDEVDFSNLRFDSGPRAAIEECNCETSGRLVIGGWATYHGQTPEHRLEAIQVVLDGEILGECREFGKRLDLVVPLGGEEAADSAWRCECSLPIPVRRNAATLLIKALSSSGRSTVIWCSSLEHALSYFNRQNWESAKREIERLESEIAWMEGSRFWKMRERWFALKRAAGLTDER